MKNYLGQTFLLAALVTAMLLLLAFFSNEFSLGGLHFRKMDILQDIRPDSPAPDADLPELAPQDSLSNASLDTFPAPNSTQTPALPAHFYPDSSQFGKRLEDYGPEQSGLKPFFAAIDSMRRQGRGQVRVAWFGDSFVEGDILLGDLRDTLQSLWGGHGVGFAPMSSEVAQFRRSFKQTFRGWQTFGIVKNHDSGQPFGINGFVYKPEAGANLRLEGLDYFKNTRSCERFRLFYKAEKTVKIAWKYNGEAEKEALLPATNGKIGTWLFERPGPEIRVFECRFPEPEGFWAYGASLEDRSGFCLDNFSMRGLTGGKLKHIAHETAQQFDAALGYDLIVLQLGLNAVTPSLRNIPWYEKELDETFLHLKKCFPGKPILVVSVADRAGKVNGELATMPSVPAIVAMQRRLAQKHGTLFWDMFHGMGGPGTMLHFANNRPALANRDYTHLTHEGGKYMGHLFARFLLGLK